MYQVVINGSRAVHEIQKDFNDIFPYLKIEFFHDPCYRNKAISQNQLASSHQLLMNIGGRIVGVLSFDKTTTVTELEENFRNEFGLCVQVFRKSGTVWIETIATGNWTLEQQNEEGRSISEHLRSGA